MYYLIFHFPNRGDDYFPLWIIIIEYYLKFYSISFTVMFSLSVCLYGRNSAARARVCVGVGLCARFCDCLYVCMCFSEALNVYWSLTKTVKYPSAQSVYVDGIIMGIVSTILRKKKSHAFYFTLFSCVFDVLPFHCSKNHVMVCGMDCFMRGKKKDMGTERK